MNIKLVDLRRQLRDRDRKIEDIQKTHQVIDSENVLQVKLLETTAPHSQILKQYDVVNRLREQLAVKDAELVRERLEKEEIFRDNIVQHTDIQILNKELEDLKISFSNHPTTALTSHDNSKPASRDSS